MAQQTAVEWLIEQIESCKITMYNDGDRKKLISLVEVNLIAQAKQMEREQIQDAWDDGVLMKCVHYEEDYYTQTYGTRLQNETNSK